MRHLLLSSLLVLSGCSLIRVSGLPFGSPSSTVAAPSAAPSAPAAAEKKEVEPEPIAVPPEGVVVRANRLSAVNCEPNQTRRVAVVAVLEISAPAIDWALRATSDNSVKPILVKDGDALSGCPMPSAGSTLEPGRYRLAVTWNRGDDVDLRQTVAFFPGKPSPLLHAAVPAEVPLKERALDLWYPFVEDKAQALELAPRQLFVFAEAGKSATVWYRTSVSSRWDDKPEVERVTLSNEPLLRLQHRYDTYLASDLTELQGAKTVEKVEGALTWPSTPRGAWLGMESLMAGAVDPLKAEVVAFRKQWQVKEDCLSGAIGRFDAATRNVIITPKQRAAASDRLAKDRKLCRESETLATRDALKAKLLQARRELVQQQADAVRPRLTAMFAP